MADNRVFANGRQLELNVSTADAAASSDFESGKAILVGSMPGVCLNDMSSNRVVVDFEGVYKLTVWRPSTVGDGRVGSKVYWNSTAIGTSNGTVALPSGTTAVPSTGSALFGTILDSIAAGNSSANTTGVRVRLAGAPIGAISAAAAT